MVMLVFSIGYTLNFATRHRYHIDVIRTNMSRSTSAIFEQIHDELADAVRDYIPTSGNGMCFILFGVYEAARLPQSGSRYLSSQPFNV